MAATDVAGRGADDINNDILTGQEYVLTRENDMSYVELSPLQQETILAIPNYHYSKEVS